MVVIYRYKGIDETFIKECIMKIKRLVVILMVLIFSTVGLFANIPHDDIPTAVATLKANIGEFLYHGFADSELDTTFESTLTVEDAFTAAPSFWYGYRTNAAGTYVFRMSVTDFVNQDDLTKVKIKSVTSSEHPSMSYSTEGYELFTETNSIMTESSRSDYTFITITPATVATGTDHTGTHVIAGVETVGGASAGAYVATITFTVGAS